MGSRVVASAALGAVMAAMGAATAPARAALPDGRVYELVTRAPAGAGGEGGASGSGAVAVDVSPGFLAASSAGGAVDWQGFGGCCGASSGALNLFRSVRGPDGWQARAVTPTPQAPLHGLAGDQAAVFWSGDLTRTVFATPAPYAAGDRRPVGANAEDLYLQDGAGAMTWLSQGPTGSGSRPVSAELDGASPDASRILFSSAEALTPNAAGLMSLNPPAQYLYLRDVAAGTTTLLDVDSGGALLSPYGASLGDGGWLHEDLVPPDYEGTTTDAISADGTKVFLQAPPPGHEVEGASGPHLYMRDLAAGTTTPLDDPTAGGWARYEGAAADGSLVFFTSDEGLAGASGAPELYEFNTTGRPIGAAAPMSAAAIGGGEGAIGETAISGEGTRVYFVSTGALANNESSAGARAQAGEPNLYVYDTRTAQIAFVATLAWPDVSRCDPDCRSGHPVGLVAQPDLARPAYPTPDGSVLAFSASGDLTGQAGGPASTLTSAVFAGALTLPLASSAGFAPGQTVAIGTGRQQELDTVLAVPDPGAIELSEHGPDGLPGLADGYPAGAPVRVLHSEVYRYAAAGGTLLCLSCVPAGVTPAGSSTLGPDGAGGSYAPGNRTAPLSADGEEVFFESPDRLTPDAKAPPSGAARTPNNVYEWEAGRVQLLSDGSGAAFGLDGTTPSGGDVFLTTRAQLTGEPTAGRQEIYDARVGGGGFPQPPGEPQEPCGGEGEGCRAPQGAGATLAPPLPASAVLGMTGELPEQGPRVPLAISLRLPSSAQLHRLARGGRLALWVSATAPGTVTVEVTARLGGAARRVAQARVRLPRAATTVLTLTLSRVARRALARSGTLRLRLRARDSAGGAPATLELTLRRAGGAPDASIVRG